MNKFQREIEITVTEADNELGCRSSTTDCPVALALAREFPTEEIHVHPHHIIVDGHQMMSPEPVRRFVLAYDRSEWPKPFSFVLDPSRWRTKCFSCDCWLAKDDGTDEQLCFACSIVPDESIPQGEADAS